MAAVNEDTEITIPLRNLIAIVTAIAVASWTYAGINERLNMIEHTNAQNKIVMDLNTEFRTKWPRGEMGSLPADSRQDMLIESLERKLSELHHVDNEVDALKIRVGALEEYVNSPNPDVSILTHKIEVLREQIDALKP